MTWVLLLRAVNLGATNKIAMKDLRELLEALGHTDVKTYLNSGNAVFSSSKRSAASMAKDVEKGLQERHGLDVRATLRTKEDLTAALEALPRELLGTRYVTLSFLFDKPTAASLKEARAWDVSPERIVIGDGVVYIAYAEGVHNSKLTTAALEKKLGVATTARTPETIRKLLA